MLLFCITRIFALCNWSKAKHDFLCMCAQTCCTASSLFESLFSTPCWPSIAFLLFFSLHFIITSSSLFLPLQLSDCNLYQVHAVNNIDYIWWTAGCRTQEAFSRTSKSAMVGFVAFRLDHLLLLAVPSPMIFWWLLLNGFLSGGKAKWMTADVFP